MVKIISVVNIEVLDPKYNKAHSGIVHRIVEFAPGVTGDSYCTIENHLLQVCSKELIKKYNILEKDIEVFLDLARDAWDRDRIDEEYD
jgi:hypothetical protein